MKSNACCPLNLNSASLENVDHAFIKCKAPSAFDVNFLHDSSSIPEKITKFEIMKIFQL